MTTRRIKCRFCDYTVPVVYRTRAGVTRNWFPRMTNHIEYVHPAEARQQKQEHKARLEFISATDSCAK